MSRLHLHAWEREALDAAVTSALARLVASGVVTERRIVLSQQSKRSRSGPRYTRKNR